MQFSGRHTRSPSPHLPSPGGGHPSVSAYRLFAAEKLIRVSPLPNALSIGALLGFHSGLTGVGGGIFLSPLLLLLVWGRAKEVSAVAALFILLNSVAGLLGHVSSLQAILQPIPFLAVAAFLGGVTGSLVGCRHLSVIGIGRALAVVLTIAGAKLIIL